MGLVRRVRRAGVRGGAGRARAGSQLRAARGPAGALAARRRAAAVARAAAPARPEGL